MAHFFGSGFDHDEGFFGGNRGRAASKTIDLYKILGVAEDATPQQIKRAYHQLCVKYHPDKNPGHEDTFKEVNTAYSVLSDPKSRQIYDQTGSIDGQSAGGSGGESYMDAADIMNMMFNGGFSGSGSRRQEPRKQRTQDVASKLKLTLQQAYSGCRKRMRVTREVVCGDCTGKGGSCVETCDQCKGRGVVTEIRQLGPVQQRMQFGCPKCQQKGEYITEKNKCKTCKGKKTCKVQEEIEVVVGRGTTAERKIVVSGKADEYPGALTGNLVFEVEIAPHEVFTVKGEHLIMHTKVSLSEALLGTSLVVSHLNGESLVIKTRPGEVLKNENCLIIREMGMPVFERETLFGSLLVFYEVVLPEFSTLSQSMKDALTTIPALNSTTASSGAKQCFAMQVDRASIQNEYSQSTNKSNESSGAREETRDPNMACQQI